MSKRVIDVSEHNGVINWVVVKKNVDGAILRCGYGDNIKAQDDKMFARNLAECERLGIPHGVYLYSYATTETQAKSELEHILRLIKGHKFELPIYLDVEENGTQKFAAKACKIVCDGLKAAGYDTGVYASLSWWDNYLKNITAYNRWVAQWGSKCTYNGKYQMWQYTESGRIDGVLGNVDINYFYEDFAKSAKTTKKTVDEIAAEVIAGKWGNGNKRKSRLEAAGYSYTAVQLAVNRLLAAKKSNTEIAREVIAGKWGNGTDRENRLKAAGYDYAAVQAEVNKIMKG